MKKLTIDETIERYEKYLSLDITTVEPWIARSMMGTLNDLRTEIEKKYPELLGDSATHDEIDDDFRYLSLYCRHQNLMNRIQDAKDHAEDMGIDISEADAKEIAEEFIDNHDCNQTENDQFEGIINEFVKNRETDRGY
jgi:hypothetical protein